MPHKRQKTIFSNEGAIIDIVDETVGVTDTTRRPLTGEALKRVQEYVARREELRRLAEEHDKNNELTGKPPQQQDDEVSELK